MSGAPDKRGGRSQRDAGSHQRIRSQGSDRGVSSNSQHRPVELVARDCLHKNDWQNFRRQDFKTPHQSPRSRAESDERRRPPPNWEGLGDQVELNAVELNLVFYQDHSVPRSRSRSQSQSATAKYQSLWNSRSFTNAICREDLRNMLSRM